MGMDGYEKNLSVLFTVDGGIRMNTEVYRAILSAHIQTELRGQNFTVQMGNDIDIDIVLVESVK